MFNIIKNILYFIFFILLFHFFFQSFKEMFVKKNSNLENYRIAKYKNILNEIQNALETVKDTNTNTNTQNTLTNKNICTPPIQEPPIDLNTDNNELTSYMLELL
jgi:hypothetical protein